MKDLVMFLDCETWVKNFEDRKPVHCGSEHASFGSYSSSGEHAGHSLFVNARAVAPCCLVSRAIRRERFFEFVLSVSCLWPV